MNLEGWRIGCRPWGVGDDGRIGNLLEKTQCERGDFSQTRRIYFSNRRWTNQTSWRGSRPENIHLDTAATSSRRKSPWFSWRIRSVSSTTSRLISGCRWSNKWFCIHVRKLHGPPSRWTQSQTSLAERRIIPYSTEIHWHYQNYSYEFGCPARATHRWLLEYRWVKRFVWFMDRFHSIYSIGRKTLQTEKSGPGRDWRENNWHPGQIIHYQKSGNAKLKDKEFKETIKNGRKELETSMAPAMPSRAIKAWELWKIQWNQLKTCVYLGSQWIYQTAYGRIITESSWRAYCRKRRQFMAGLKFWFTNFFLCLKPWKSPQQRQQWTRNGKNGENFGVEPDESQK